MTGQQNAPGSLEEVRNHAIRYVRTGRGFDDHIRKFGTIKFPRSGGPGVQVDHILALLKKYHENSEADKPISIAVFGPPGSGKSTLVGQIGDGRTGCVCAGTINLTQTTGTVDLAQSLKRLLCKKLKNPNKGTLEKAPPTPILFIDEFDAALDGVPLGWLPWFLAPMQDGELRADGQSETIGKAVFIFAGGTAETLEEFTSRAQMDPEAYRARKVPDFVSRLRGAVDINGLNGSGDARIVSRAIALRNYYVPKDEESAPRTIEVDDEATRRYLSNGHFIHGVRSMRMMLDTGLGKDGAPSIPEAILRQHFSRGTLDGLLVGISTGLDEKNAGGVFGDLTNDLLGNGATLAYGGALTTGGTLNALTTAVDAAPPDLIGPDERNPANRDKKTPPRVRNYLGNPANLAEGQGHTAPGVDFEFIPLTTISDRELSELEAPVNEPFDAFDEHNPNARDLRRHVAWALSLFRLRVRMLQDVSAVVVLGGKNDGKSWGRFPGIAEEVMIALALGKPLFIMGGVGGAAYDVGRLLGLSREAVIPETCLETSYNPELEQALELRASSFEIPGVVDSPKSLAEVRRFLFHRGVTTPAWPWNGLNIEDNRKLFACRFADDDTDESKAAVHLILKGLSRIDWKPKGAGRDPAFR